MQTIEEKVAELNARKQGLQEATTFLAERKREYEAAIEKPAAFAEREEREIRALLASKVPVSLQTYVEELAKLWNTNVRNLDATLIVETFNGQLSMEEMVKELVAESLLSSRPKNSISFLVDYKDGPVMHTACISRPITKGLFKEEQKDGKPFVSHLRPEVVKIRERCYESSLVCDDYTPLVFNFAFGDMTNIMYDPNYKTEDNIALLNAAIRDNQAYKQEEKSL